MLVKIAVIAQSRGMTLHGNNNEWDNSAGCEMFKDLWWLPLLAIGLVFTFKNWD